MIDRFVNFFSSLWLTTVCLACAMVLVFAGTMAQVHLGLYGAQAEYFHSFFVHWTPAGGHARIPVFPGGWVIGPLLLMNLLAGHIKRFEFSRRKIGLLLAHAGLILLLAGQFVTDIFQVESHVRLAAGESSFYSEDNRRNELVIIDTTDPKTDKVVSIGESTLAKGGAIQPEGLPLTVSVKKYFVNSQPAGPMSGAGEKLKATQGIGQRLLFTAAPEVGRLDDENKPAAVVEISAAGKSLGTWTVSTWLSRPQLVGALQSELGGMFGVSLREPQGFSHDGRHYELALRPARYYRPYSLTLLEFRHETYPGTDIPKAFASKVHFTDPARGEDRDVVISMNQPLRYHGETFYQSSFEPGDRVSILQVVRNPASLSPYLACSMVGLGLVIQFLTHLFRFARRRAGVEAEAARSKPRAKHHELIEKEAA